MNCFWEKSVEIDFVELTAKWSSRGKSVNIKIAYQNKPGGKGGAC